MIRRWDQVTAARLPKPKLGRVDVFAPEIVVWAYEGPAECTLRALLTLVRPQHPDAPTGVYPAPRSLHVPRHQQRPMSIQLPSASRSAGVEFTDSASGKPAKEHAWSGWVKPG
jgi:hypothetical protein